jgi:LytS/YehU family sensor histidine kinase
MSVKSEKTGKTHGEGRAMFIFINVLVWVIILSFPFMLATRDGSFVQLDKYVVYSWIPVMFMLAFYFNYYFLIDKLIFEKRRLLLFLLCNFVMIIIVASCSHILQNIYLTRIVDAVSAPVEKFTLATYIIRDGLVLMLVIGLSVALKMVLAWQEHQSERTRLESEKRNAELQNLRSQLNPHFLFNTLNNIYSLTGSNPDKAREAIHSLSSILRYILYNSETLVPLDKEFGFIRSYIELMRLRQTENMTIETSLPDDEQVITIAPLMFIALIENGFKHGVSPTEPSFVRIAITIDRNKKGRQIVTCRVENSFYPKADTDRSGSGIGIGNLRRRLALLYPKQHTLSMDREGNTYIAQLTITL